MNKPDPDLVTALRQLKKAELIDGIVALADSDPAIKRRIIMHFGVQKSPEQCCADTRAAILAATDFDPRDINHNFSYDIDAYIMVEHNFTLLVTSGHLDVAMELALFLMERSSHQMVMSDEGLMLEDIESCLTVVLNAVATAPLDPDQRRSWLRRLSTADESQFICSDTIAKLMPDG